MLRRSMVLILCFLLFGGVLTGCGGQVGPADTQKGGLGGQVAKQEIIAGLGRDPGEMYNYGAHPPLTRVLEPLIFSDVELGLTPGLAESCTASKDGLTWTIVLQEGVKFHDGSPFDAEAVAHNLKRIADTWPDRLGPVETIEAVDELVVKVTHNEPYAPFLYSLAWPGSAMICPTAVDAEGNVAEPVGTGPFRRESWVPNEEMVLVKNEQYWGGAPKLERIVLKYIPDPTTRMMALEAGEIDMIIDTGGVLPEQVPTLEKNEQIKVLTVAGAVPHYLTFNNQKSPLDDVRVRRAIMYAIDPQSIIKYALEGFGKAMSSVIPYLEKDWMHSDNLFTFNDPDKAVQLLQEAGWDTVNAKGIREKDGEECRLKYLLSSALVGRWPYQPIAEVVLAQLAEVGIEVEIETVETGLWKETLEKGGANISMRPWAGISPQSRLHEWLHSEGENTLAMGIFYSNPQVDRLIEDLLKTTNEKEAKELSYRVQELAGEEVPIIPMYDEVLINAVRKNVKGYNLHPSFIVNWEDIYIE